VGHKADRIRNYILHILQKKIQTGYVHHGERAVVPLGQEKYEKRFFLFLFRPPSSSPFKLASRSFPVLGGTTLEFCLSQALSSFGTSELSFEIFFHGIVPQPKELHFPGGCASVRVDLDVLLLPPIISTSNSP